MSLLVEELLRRAIENGDFDHLPNAGKKLDLSNYFAMPAEKRLGYTLLKDAHFVPPEVEILRAIGQIKQILSQAAPTEAQTQRKRLRELELRLALLRENH